MNTGSLNCPNCGAAVASDKSQCPFCGSQLKTVACPQCFAMMFEGTKFCGNCGAMAHKITAVPSADLGPCPRCKVNLEHTSIGEAAVHICPRCSGIWLDEETFNSVCKDREAQAAVLNYLTDTRPPEMPPAKISYVPCPSCGQLMNRNNFLRVSGIIVDVCKHHGVWFDADELTGTINFIQNGGIELAHKHELQELRDEHGRIADERRQLSSDAAEFAPFEKTRESSLSSWIEDLFG